MESDNKPSSDDQGSEVDNDDPSVIVHHSPQDRRSKYRYNPFCRLLFCWIDPLLWLGFKRPLLHSDLYVHPQECDAARLLDKFNRYWSQELSNRGSPSLLRVLLKVLWWRIIIHGIILLSEVCMIVGVGLLVGLLSDYFVLESPSSDDTRTAYLQAMGVSLLSVAVVLVHGLGFHYSHYLGVITRVFFTNAIYQKILRISHVTVNTVTLGHIVNLASNDLHRFDQSFLFVQYFWIAPLHLSVITYLIWEQISWTAFLTTGLVLLQAPLQLILVTTFSRLRFMAARLTDKRIKIMNEVITGIRVIKMYAWEYPFHDLVASIRKSEVWLVVKASVIRGINLASNTVSQPFILFIVISVFVSVTPLEPGQNSALTPQIVFTILSLVAYVRIFSLHFFITGLLTVIEARVAFKRIKEFLLLKELHNEDTGISKEMDNKIPLAPVHGDGGHISADQLTASWNMDSDNLVLENVSFAVDKSKPLLAVVGKVGSGKSTLLQCLLKELPCLSGNVSLKGTIGYASQEAWIFSATVRENVTFGLPYQSDWYNQVIECCALDRDIDILPEGDLTLVGERGVTLSGGQKARVNLARAVYRNADVYLLDDPLSAVDTVVSRHIFDRCIRNMLSNKLVVLVTHQLQYLQQCDSVLVLKEGRVSSYGNPLDILSGSDLTDFLQDDNEKKDDPRSVYAVRKESIIPSVTENSGAIEHLSKLLPSLNVDAQEDGDDNDQLIEGAADASVKPLLPMDKSVNESHPRQLLTKISEEDEDNYDELIEGVDPFMNLPVAVESLSHHSLSLYHQENNFKDKEATKKQPMKLNGDSNVVPAEQRELGVVTLKTYYRYFTAGGSILVIIMVLFLFVIGEVNIVIAEWWIADWATCSSNDSTSLTCRLDNDAWIGIGGGLIFSSIFFVIVRYCCFMILLLNASRLLHNKMFATVIRTPILFFDTNPIGRILNRFSKDIGFLDDLLPYVFCEFVMLVFRTVATFIVVLIANPATVVSLIVFVVILLALRWYYLRSAREVKRLEALARSPVYSHISLTLQGLSTIRSYSMQSESTLQFQNYLNRHSQASYAYLVVVRWFGLRIDLICALYISIVAILSVTLSNFFGNPALVGLGLVYAIRLNGMFQYCIRQSAEVESLMISAERVMGYGILESEASLETEPPAVKPAKSWPSQGAITFDNLSYRYSSNAPSVLKGLNCTINKGEKIGIVGRTGAGKSSLVSSLFRLAEPSTGSIIIDDIDICSIGLHDIRSKLSIIPQDPVLFGGTIRYNMDPFHVFDDDALWKALEQVQLKEVVQSHDGLLDGEVHEGGGNFSVGQRQLFCLARALLRNNKILILDEATANVDLETDSIIQQVIRDQFDECTVLTIAHRLDTVMDSDRIMVLRTGALCEFDEPHVLLSDPSSYLTRLVDHTGVMASNRLKEMAAVAYNKRKRT